MALTALPPVGAPIDLVTSRNVREDVLARYGFTADDNSTLFHRSLSVQAIGPRLALHLDSVLPAADLRQTIAAGDKAALTRLPGVGNRIAGHPLTRAGGGSAASSRAGDLPASPAGGPFVQGWGSHRHGTT